VAGHVNLRDDSHTTCGGVGDDLLQHVLGEDLVGGIGVFGHLREGVNLHRPRLRINKMPVQDVELGKRHSIDLFKDLGFCDEVATSIYHDSTDWVKWRVLDGDGLFDNHVTRAIIDNNLLQCCQGMEGAIDGSRGNVYGIRTSCEVESVGFVNTMLELSMGVGNINLDLGDRTGAISSRWRTILPPALSRRTGRGRKRLKLCNRGFSGCGNPFQLCDCLGNAIEGGRKHFMVGRIEFDGSKREAARVAPGDARGFGKRVGGDSISLSNEQG